MLQNNLIKYFFIVGIIIFIIISLLDIKDSKEEYSEEKKLYYNKEIRGKLISKRINRGFRNKIAEKGLIRKEYLYSSRNYDYKPYNLYDFLQLGDSIVKPKNSLDLYIHRKENVYYFKLGEYINE